MAAAEAARDEALGRERDVRGRLVAAEGAVEAAEVRVKEGEAELGRA